MITANPPRIRYFTPREANEVLPELSELVARCSELLNQVRHTRDQANNRLDLDDDTRSRLLEQADELRVEIDHMVEHLSTYGVELKGVEPGLIDFPALRNGQEAYLCWREGERKVSWWHPTHTGFAGRRPLDFANLASWEWCN